MAERISIIGSTSASGAPTWTDDELQEFEKDFLNEGVISGLAVTENGTPNMTVNVGTGVALIEITNTNLTPSKTYKVYFTVDATKSLTVTTADGTNPRKDRVILEVLVNTNPNAASSNVAVARIVAGTPAGSPAAPAEPSNSITLAIIDIPASDTTIGTAQILDSRTYVTAKSAVLADLQREATALKTTRLKVAASTELTIATGAVTVTQPFHTIDTEANAASDDLDTITAAYGEGEIVHLRADHTDRTVVVKHNTGNIRLADGLDFPLDDTDKSLTVIRKGSTWQELCRGGPSIDVAAVDLRNSRIADGSDVGASSTAELDLGTGTSLSGGSLEAGDAIHLVAHYDYDEAGGGTMTLRLKLGATTLLTVVDSAATTLYVDLWATVRDAGASGVVEVTGNYWINTAVTRVNATVSGMDFTTALTLKSTVQFSASNASNRCREETFLPFVYFV